jgi:hypothetical protein
MRLPRIGTGMTRVTVWALMSAVLAAAGFAQQQSITNYKVFQSGLAPGQTNWYQYIYGADLLNTGPALTSATATLSVSVSNIQIVAGQNTLNFGPVSASGQVTSKNQFTILVNRSVQFKLTDLHWTIQAVAAPNVPIANAGPNQTADVGSTVTLDGSKSSNPSGIGTLTYTWAFTSKPAASATTLVNPTSVNPTFLLDVPGTYTIQLTVSNGSASASASTTVNNAYTIPVASAGPNQSVALNTRVTLDGSKSTDVDGNPLTYSWQFTTIPAGSAATLSGANTVSPTFTVDEPGKYIAQLVVNDGMNNSNPSSVTIFQNSPPVANAGPSQGNVSLGSTVQLDGSQSTDADGDSLSYTWSLIALPAGSNATLSTANQVESSFVLDVAGIYVAQLIVNDGTYNSSPSTVAISTGAAILHPTANAGPPQQVIPHGTVTLDGSASFDPQGLPLTYSWSFLSKPTGSTAVLSSNNAIKPTFVSDLAGTYIVQLIVSNSYLTSAPSTVMIAIDPPPVANAGSPQNGTVGVNVVLNGGGSFDADNDTLNYAWSFSSRPPLSTATLSGANTVAPTFTPDVAGLYVVQLIVSDSLQSSNPPATVNITVAGSKVITLTPNPLNIGTTGTSTLTVTLASPAGSGGQVVTLVSSNTGVAKVPASVTIPANATFANVTVTPVAVGTTNITGSASGFTSGAATVNVVRPTATITLNSATVSIGGQVTGQVTLNVPLASAISASVSANPSGIVTVGGSVTIPAGATTAPFTITGAALGTASIRAAVPGYNSVVASVTVVKLLLISLPSALTVQAGQPPVNLAVSLQNPAPTGGVTVTLASADTTKATVPASVFIAAGNTMPATEPQVTGIHVGAVNITASAPGYATTSTSITVIAGPPATITATAGTGQSKSIGFAFNQFQVTVTDSLGNLVSGAPVTFTAPGTGPSGTFSTGGVTTTATTSAAGVASATLTANLIKGGPYSVTATGGAATPASFSLINLAGPPKNMTATNGGGQSAQILTPFANVLVATVTDVAGNAVSGASVTFTAPATGAGATFGATASVTTDVNGLATSPAITAGATAGTYGVTATATGASGVSTTFSLTNTPGPPASIKAVAGTTPQSTPTGEVFAKNLAVTVKDAGGNLLSGASVTFSAPSSSASGFFGATTSATVTTNGSGTATAPPFLGGLTQGSYNVTATVQTTVPNVAPATFTLTNAACPGCASISAGNVSVGQNLQTETSLLLSTPPPAQVLVTISTSDPTKVLLSGRAIDPGVASLVVPFVAGTSVQNIYVHGVASSGSAFLIASAPGYVFGVATVNLTPSGFVLSTNNQLGGNLVTHQGVQTPMILQAYQLDSSLTPIAPQSVSAGITVNVPIQNSNPSVGTISPASPVSFAGPSDTVNGVSVTFTASFTNTGNTILTVGVPPGFSAPISSTTTTTVTVNSSQLMITQGNPTIGQNLQTTGQVLISGVAGSQVSVTITSSDPTKLLFSTSPTAAGTVVAGQNSIVVTIAPGFSRSSLFYLQNVSSTSSGSVIYTAKATGYNTLTSTATLAPSGVIVYGPFGAAVPSFTTTTQSTPTTITVETDVLNSGNTPIGPESVAGGQTVSSNIKSSNTALGTITVSPVVIGSGTSSTTTQFQPNNTSTTGGSVTISADVPSGFTPPAANQSTTAVVNIPGMSLSDNGRTIGQNLQIQDAVVLGAPAPAAGLQVTITSNNPGVLMLAVNPTDAGTSSITITIPAGFTSGAYYLQAFTNSGTATYSASAPAFQTVNGSITMGNSGVAVAGPLGLGAPGGNETHGVADNTWAVYTLLLDANNKYVQAQSLRAGMTVIANLTSTNPTVGTIASPVTITGGGANNVTTTFTPLVAGSTSVILAQPSNLGLAANQSGGFYNSIPVTVQ